MLTSKFMIFEAAIVSVSHLISSLLAHQLVIQLIGSILCPCTSPPAGLEKILAAGECCGSCEIPDDVRIMMHHCLDASFQLLRFKEVSAQLTKKNLDAAHNHH
ncbi:hypothetical protein OESDEN_02225 [Oesophagostomum dentatum]|uniref:Uncharacterized protein n=1 Tax=Oesophagostomum dentatum TaxID=61180 RepID=A0A0B1TQV8_OESDE|nr:hypothetical protein OESDEN_02225 [Oesophagostomum dentatum]